MFIPIGTEEISPRRQFPFVTIILVALNSLNFLFELFIQLWGGGEALNLFITVFGVIPAAVTGGQSLLLPFFLTPFTAMFVHSSLTHIGFNMLYLLAFGDNVEDQLGHGRFLIFYLISGLLATLVHVATRPVSPVPTIGASGAIAGVFGAYLLLFPRGKVRVFFFLGPLSHVTRISALIFIGFWFMMQFFNGLGSLGVVTVETEGVAYWAHIGGFVGGLGLAWLYQRFLARVGSALVGTSQ